MRRYSAAGHGGMAADGIRVRAYTEALRATVRPGSVVLEIGTGTGLFAILASRMGARVYAIEADDIIESARLNAAANGCGDRITFLQGMSTQLSLPERADVLISDMRGVLPHHEHHIESLVDARRRLLAPGAAVIPASDRLWMACIEAAKLHGELVDPWRAGTTGVELPAARDLVTNSWQRAQIEAGQLRTEAALCGSLDYAAVEKADFEGRVSMRVTRPGAAHGLCAWFDTTLAPGIGFTNAPGAPPTVYGQAYFPWPEAVELGAGHVVEASIGARLLGDDYTWAWETRVLDPAGRTLCRFRQSNFAGEPLSSDTLRRRSASHVPVLGEEARADALALGMMDQGMALGDVARELAARFPGRFRRWEDALAHAGDLSLKYGR